MKNNNQNQEMTTKLNIENYIFEDLNNGLVYQTEIFKMLDNMGITIEDIELAGFEYILDDSLGICINVNKEDERNTLFNTKLVVFLYNSLELGYRDFLTNKKVKK